MSDTDVIAATDALTEALLEVEALHPCLVDSTVSLDLDTRQVTVEVGCRGAGLPHPAVVSGQTAAMTVAELIEALAKFSPDAPVLLSDEGAGYFNVGEIESVSVKINANPKPMRFHGPHDIYPSDGTGVPGVLINVNHDHDVDDDD